MSITQLIDEILESRTFKNACKTGDLKNLRILMQQAMYDVYMKTKNAHIREYGNNKLATTPMIKDYLRAVPPPTDLGMDPKLKNLDLYDKNVKK